MILSDNYPHLGSFFITTLMYVCVIAKNDVKIDADKKSLINKDICG